MQCPNCGHNNPETAKFCSRCGNSLSVACPVCSTIAEPGAQFCTNCGASLAASGSTPTDGDLTQFLPEELMAKLRAARAGHAMKGERRTVTMLFADIKGSTAAAEILDPEDWAHIVNGAFEHLIAPVYRYEGTLAHLQGDAVLAFFGAPIAHEDDPVRALRAGLEIIDAIETYSRDVEAEWGIPIEVRVGVNTGLVVVGEVGSDLRVEYTALGDAINVAARMEQTADPGTVQVTEETLKLTGNMFDVESLGPIEVKGKAKPVEAHRVLGLRRATPTDEGHPIVGRETELDLLAENRSRLSARTGWVTSIIADAGLGKSSLISEFRRRSAEQGTVASRVDQEGEIFWMYGTCRSYESSTPFALMKDLLRRWWGGDGIAPEFGRVETSLDAAGIDDPDAAAFLAYIADLDLPPEAESFLAALETPVRHARANETLVAYLSGMAGLRPGIIVLEDLHWADDLSLAFIEDIMELTEKEPLGLLVAMRPYREEPTWRIHEVAERDHHHRYTSLDLAPLDQADGAALVESLLDTARLSDETKRRILERSDGNPMFIEQMVNSVSEAGTEDLAVPSSLSGILTARLDRLDESTRFVVQMASVLGSEFDRETLAVLLPNTPVEQRVIDLLRREILVEKEDGSGRLGFRHALIQDNAYGTILLRTRKQLHGQVANHLIERHPESVQEIARHLMEFDVVEAFPYLVEAGLKSSRSMALGDAIRSLTTALENVPLDADPGLVERAYTGLGEAHALVPDLTLAAASYQRLYDYGEQTERPEARVAALNNLGYATASLGLDLEGAAAYLEEARRLAEECGDELGLAQYHMNACFVASMAGQIGDAVAHDEATVNLGEKQGNDSIRLSGLVRRGTNYALLLDFERGEPAVQSAIEAAEEAEMDEAVAILRATAEGLLRFAAGDIRRAIELGEDSAQTLERFSSFYAGLSQRFIGFAKFYLGDLEGALSNLTESRRLATKLGQSFVTSTSSAMMAHIYAVLGETGPIDELCMVALESLNETMGDFFANSTRAELGFCYLELGRTDEAASEFQMGLTSSSTSQYIERPRLLAGQALAATRSGDLSTAGLAIDEAKAFMAERAYLTFEPLVLLAEAEVLEVHGRFDAARAVLETASGRATKQGMSLLLGRIKRALSRIADDSGARDDASRLEAEAKGLLETIASTIVDDSLRETFRSRWLVKPELDAKPVV